MKYNFDQIVDRKGSYSVKWDLKENVIPLWVADMDFHVAEEIEESLIKRAKHGVYGYSIIPQEYYDAEQAWWKNRHNTLIDKEWILPTIGVIPALSSSVDACTNEGDKVITFSPVYQYFYSSITNNKAEVVHCPLINQQGHYTIDFDLFEKQAKDEKAKMVILCNPHNPVGRVWTKQELQTLADICLRNNLVILSDEIHRDLTYEKQYTPMIHIEEAQDNIITCTAPSKTFNVAGLKTANMIVSNPMLRQKVEHAMNCKEVIEPGVFGIDGLIAAYTKGNDWLNQLLVYLQKNRDFSYQYFQNNLPKSIVTPLEGTYLLWIDVSAYNVSSKTIETDLIERGVYLNGGYKYGDSDTHIRINLATSQKNLQDAYEIITKYITEQQNK